MKHLTESAPRRAEIILDKMANDEMTMRLEIDHLEEVIKSVNKAANRLSLSIIAASCIIGGKFLLEAFFAKQRQSRLLK